MTVVAFEERRPEALRGRMLYQALLTVHTHIRGGLGRVQRLRLPSATGSPRRDCTRSSKP
jgi:hypothetical protein